MVLFSVGGFLGCLCVCDCNLLGFVLCVFVLLYDGFRVRYFDGCMLCELLLLLFYLCVSLSLLLVCGLMGCRPLLD